MQDDNSPTSQSPWGLWASRAFTALVTAYLAAALVMLVAAPFLAIDYTRIPFAGAFIEHTLALNSSGSSQVEAWELQKKGLPFGYRVIALDGVEITSLASLREVLKQHDTGDKVEIKLASPEGATSIFTLTLRPFSSTDFIAYFIIPYLISLAYLVCSIWVFAFRRRDDTGKAFAIFSASVAIVVGGLFDLFTTSNLVYGWTFGLMMAGGGLVCLTLMFPENEDTFPRQPILRWLGLLPGLVIFLLTLPTLYDYQHPLTYALGWRAGYIYGGLATLFFLGGMFYRLLKTTSPVIREQTRLILIGASFAFSPIAIWFLSSSIWHSLAFSPLLLLPIAIFPVIIAYALARYRLLQTEFIFQQVLIYSTITLVTAAGLALLISGLTLLFGGSKNASNPYVLGALLFLLAMLFLPLFSQLQKVVNSAFSRGQAFYRERLQSFSRELTQLVNLPDILHLLRKYVNETLVPFHLHIFVLNSANDQYEAAPDDAGKPTSDLLFTPQSYLVETLSRQRTALFLGDVKTLPVGLKEERSRLHLLGSQLYVPLPGQRKLSGWISLGSRRSGEPYNTRDLNFAESLCDQAALAIERAQVVIDLERRVHATNILTLISQGINVTVNFDDILELIYAQTHQVIPALDYRITLYDHLSDVLYHAFFLENDERLTERENQPIPLSQGLEREVVRTRRSIVTDDYERECRARGGLPTQKEIYAWIGVPLNTGTETIGAISLGSRDPTVNYIAEQVNLFQAIADQAAGAIVKARLLQEAERRARQLTMLNEVARNLSSTLELDPLLNLILNSAVTILNCDAGSLLLVDDETGEYVFEAATGPVGADLVGKRLPPGTGLVGKAVESRQPIIVNDVRRTKDWSEKTDQVTGFRTNDLLVVPMIIKDQVTGVIEVLNRRDGLPFNSDDQELLKAFTSQAAVALENARLYTQTDQSLAERVEELSVMQRIDRELNTSLEVSRAMRITLDWAMRQSRADAGLVGMIEEKGVRIMAYQGYASELSPYLESYLPEELPALQASIDTGQPQFFSRLGGNGNQEILLKDAVEQVIIPIRRESTVIGLLLLESTQTENVSDEALGFLSRLSDHAAIAIANARLYAEVQEANLAKSDFISFVSHELKTPMTSIKGFTDLLATGAVGPVNDAQSNFLSTIRSNVDRMATLVTDLTDVSRIEAGRLRLDFAAVPVTHIVDEVVRSTRTQIEERNQKLTQAIPTDLPPMWGDRTRLIQILTNLVSNAYKYTPSEGEITISAEWTENIWDEGSPRVIHIMVKDTGYGITPENQKKIFQKFYRADDQKVRDAPGTGLGLNITKQLVELQGGRIWFESVFRVGTTFHFIIPIAETV
jgi:signal transduction histidine kinase/putative methionine-R-sulfoxide reductase with GAF domain